MASVNWADDRAARKKFPPPSFYMPLLVSSDKAPYRVIPRNLVPIGKGSKDEQIGYWNVQERWRMRRGQRVDLPPKVHFYYLGTGPHKDLKFRQRSDGVVWVAKEGAKTVNTSLGNRKRNQKPLEPKFSIALPPELSVVEFEDRSNNSSRASSRSSTRNNSRDSSRSTSRQQSRTRSDSNQSSSDLVAAVTLALKNLGFDNQSKSPSSSGTSTPKKPNKPLSQPRADKPSQLKKPRWKRVPTREENVIQCFGPRDFNHNMGDSDLVQNGVDAKGFPQLAELIPNQAALFFDSEVSTDEVGDNVQITYTYKMLVAKDNKNLPKFIEQISAFTKPSSIKEMQSQSSHAVQNTVLNASIPESKPLADDDSAIIEIVNEVLH
uniref:Nucleoprotein n=1 Tax=Human coronavirus NL63 TaxID=277944 RepID=A0A384R2N5_CVHNL|nr:nucleocapsid protein [Human coronavirus NL63]AIW52793.1 nucleocapsid protein [Human coronavirus NL63]